MSASHTCLVCDRAFSAHAHLQRHLEVHDSLLTAEQLQCLKEPIEASDSGPSSEPDAFSKAADDAPAASDALTASVADHVASVAPAAASGFECNVCYKQYTYKRSYEAHMAKHTARGVVVALAASPEGAATPTEPAAVVADSVASKIAEAEVKLLAAILNQHKNPLPVLELLPPAALDEDLNVAYYQSQDMANRLEAILTLPPMELPQLKNKLLDFCLYQTMLEVRSLRNQQRQAVLHKMFYERDIAEGQCPVCRATFDDGDRFMSHLHNCIKLKQYTCEYCETVYSNTMSKGRHMDKCIVKRNCANSPINNPKEALQNLRNAEELAFRLLSDTLADPDISLLGKYKERLPELFRAWARRPEDTGEGEEATTST